VWRSVLLISPSWVALPVAQQKEFGRAADDGRPHEGGVGGLRHVDIYDSFGGRAFFRRVGFARQQALVDKKIPGFEHPAVGGHQVSCGEEDNVARDKLIGADRDLTTIAQRLLLKRHRDLELLSRLFSTILLDAVEQYAEQHHRRDDDQAGDVAGQRRDRGRGEKDQDEGIAKAAQYLEQK
jgi:hypothetical protein